MIKVRVSHSLNQWDYCGDYISTLWWTKSKRKNTTIEYLNKSDWNRTRSGATEQSMGAQKIE